MVVLAAISQVFGQEVLVSDSGQIAPFEGVIGYRIRYEGKVAPNMVPYLPDSMTMFVGKNGILYRYHRGHAAELQSQVLWDGDSQEFWLLDPSHETAESRWPGWKSKVAVAKPVKETLKVAGKDCNAWTLTIDKQVEKIWVNDSIWFGGTLVDSLKPQQPAFLAAGIRKIPLQSRRTLPGEVVTVVTAMKIEPGSQYIWLFKTPEAYRMREFDPSKPWHPLLEKKKE